MCLKLEGCYSTVAYLLSYNVTISVHHGNIFAKRMLAFFCSGLFCLWKAINPLLYADVRGITYGELQTLYVFYVLDSSMIMTSCGHQFTSFGSSNIVCIFFLKEQYQNYRFLQLLGIQTIRGAMAQ